LVYFQRDFSRYETDDGSKSSLRLKWEIEHHHLVQEATFKVFADEFGLVAPDLELLIEGKQYPFEDGTSN